MTHPSLKPASAAALLFSTLLIPGCASSPDPNYYVLRAPAAIANSQHATGPTILVQSVVVPDHLRRSEIVLQSDGDGLRFNTTERWAEPIDRNISDVLVSALGNRFGSANVFDRWSGFISKPDLVLRVDVGEFTVVNGESILSASWELSGGVDSKARRSSDTIRVPVLGVTTAEQVIAMEEALGTLASNIGEDIASDSGE